MARIGRPTKDILVLTDAERAALKRQKARARSAGKVAFRATIVLRCGNGGNDSEVAADLGTTRSTVGKWRKRFIAKRLDGLLDDPRPGAAREIDDDEIMAVVAKALDATPPFGRKRWSTRSMARTMGRSHSTIARIWGKLSIQAHLTESFRLSQDPLLWEKIRDIVGLYMSPRDHAVALCIDQSQMQAVERARPVLPTGVGQAERRTDDDIGHGTAGPLAALDAKSGKVRGWSARRRAPEFKVFLRELDAAVRTDQEIHVVLDNFSMSQAPVIKRWLGRRTGFYLHFTPTRASWLNLVERFFVLLSERALRRGRYDESGRQLQWAIPHYIEGHAHDPKPFKWVKSDLDATGCSETSTS